MSSTALARPRAFGRWARDPARPETLDQRLGHGAPVRARTERRPPEERRRAIRVHRDDGASALDAGHVLAGPGDAEREVERRRHRATALADLALPGEPAEVDRDPAPAHRGAEELGQDLELAKPLGAHSPA